MVRSMDAANNSAKKRIGIIVLAAGGSTRMKKPKQLLQFNEKTLLRRAVETAVGSAAEPVLVVLGANYERTKAEIADLPVEIIFNENWQSGLSSSVKSGIEHFRKLRQTGQFISACLLMLADQPFITSRHLNLLAEKFLERSDNLIVAARYEKIVGVPAIFSHAVFDDLRKLSGDEGAKKVIKKYGSLVRTINLPEAAFDIDTPHDFQNLKLQADSNL